MNDVNFMIMNYKSRIIALEKTVEAYRSSKKFEEQRAYFTQRLKEKDVEINRLKKQMEQDSLFHKKSNREWWQACEEIYNDCEKQLCEKDKKIKLLIVILDAISIFKLYANEFHTYIVVSHSI